MTDEEIQTVYLRIRDILRREHDDHDHHTACVTLSTLSSEPFERVFEVCAEIEE